MKSALELRGIAQAGGHLIVDANNYSALEMKGIASNLSNGATLTIKNADKYSALECKGIASAAPGRVSLDFS